MPQFDLPMPELAFPLDEILGLGRDEAVTVLDCSSTHTAVTLRVRCDSVGGRSYFVKTVRAAGGGQEGGSRLGAREVRFYQFMQTFDPDLRVNIPRCLRHYLAGDGRRYFLVLEDLSPDYHTHTALDFETLAPWQCALRSLAAFHRAFTGQLSAGQIAALEDDEAEVARYMDKLQDAYARFRAYARGRVDEAVFEMMESAISVVGEIELEKLARIRQNQLTTVLNRDAHVRNFLYPPSLQNLAKIVDWQFWGLGIGTFDLRHLLGSALNEAVRPHQESLVRDYYEAYTQGGKIDYAWETCWDDYRKGVLDNLFMPVWQYAGFGWKEDRWGQTLDAAVRNFRALGCAGLG